MARRGFKSWCEEVAARYRTRLGMTRSDPLDPLTLANHLTVRLVDPRKLDGLSEGSLRVLLRDDPSAWSAVTLCDGARRMIVYNPANAPQRRSNDIMHELSHLIIGHEAPKAFHSHEFGLMLRHYDAEQEEEADLLGATLLLPREALLKIRFQPIPEDVAAREYGVSRRLLTMRLNTSGVNRQHRRSAGGER